MKKRVMLCFLLCTGVASLFALDFVKMPYPNGANFLNSGLVMSGGGSNGMNYSLVTSLGYLNASMASKYGDASVNAMTLATESKWHMLQSGFSTWFNNYFPVIGAMGYTIELYFGKTWIFGRHRVGVGGGIFGGIGLHNLTGAIGNYAGGGVGMCTDYAYMITPAMSVNILMTENMGVSDIGGNVRNVGFLNLFTVRCGLAFIM